MPRWGRKLLVAAGYLGVGVGGLSAWNYVRRAAPPPLSNIYRAEPALDLTQAAVCVRLAIVEGKLSLPPFYKDSGLTEDQRAELGRVLHENEQREHRALAGCLTERQARLLGEADLYEDLCRFEVSPALVSKVDPVWGETDLRNGAAKLAIVGKASFKAALDGAFFSGQDKARKLFASYKSGTPGYVELCNKGFDRFGPNGSELPGVFERRK